MPKLLLFAAFLLLLASCKTTTFYISRHAEKAGAMSADPPLTAEGEKQALALRDYLRGKGVRGIYSTNFVRTKATARPSAEAFQLPVILYSAAAATHLLDSLVAAKRGNVLIVGHSNTVDDLVNYLTKEMMLTNLADSEYGDLFIVRKRGAKVWYERIKVPRGN